MKRITNSFFHFSILSLFLVACGNSEKEFDATGTFEATELVVSAEQGGRLLKLDVTEGDTIAPGQEVGLVDTTQIWLKIQQIDATKTVYQSQKPDMEKQIAATRQQLAKARQEQQRYKELVNDGAAPSKMLDDANSQVQVLQRQVDAQVSALNNQLSTLDAQISNLKPQLSSLYDLLQKCHITTPIGGTVLEKYAEQGEFAAVGKPLFKMADTRQMFIRAYVTSARLQQIKVGQRALVRLESGDRSQEKTYDGKVCWISSNSEFTPKTILTDDERADLVYAVKIAVQNDGFIKIGMYGEVKFSEK